jgi:mannose-6-phosphate isomerase
MTIAITPFEGLCGFRPLAEIVHFLNYVKPLRSLVGQQAAAQFEQIVKGSEEAEDAATVNRNKDALKATFTSLMESSQDQIEEAAKELVSEAENSPNSFAIDPRSETNPSGASELSEVVTRLNGQFPNDIGLFVLFFLNFVQLSPGEAMFLKADDIHAYISGDIIECMASSDNVVRAGFTPKFKDVSTLTTMLTYSYAPIEKQKMQPTEYPYALLNSVAYTSGSSTILYDPTEIEEFAVVKTDLKRKGAKATFDPIPGPSIVICTGGQGKISVGPAKVEEVKEGYVFFVGADAECVIESTTEDEGQTFTTFKAFCELTGKEDLPNGH